MAPVPGAILETLGVAALAAAAGWAGDGLGRSRRRWWIPIYAGSVAAILLVALARWNEHLAFREPFSWIVGGRTRFVVLSVCGTLALVVPRRRLPRPRDRFWVAVLAVFVLGYALTPFALPAAVRGDLERLETRLSPEGICLQTRSWTCGPAAAVTALGRLGIRAEEGELAILAFTTPLAGTPCDWLASAIERRYGADGVRVEFLKLRDVAALEDALGERGGMGGDHARPVAIAVIKHSFLTDHYVTVLEVAGDTVLAGDPLVGLRWIPRAEFQRIWRRSAIVLRR